MPRRLQAPGKHVPTRPTSLSLSVLSMNLVDPRVDRDRAIAIAKRMIEAGNAAFGADTPETRIHAVQAACLALAQLASYAGVSHIEDVLDNVKKMHANIESARAAGAAAPPKVVTVAPAVFDRILEKHGVKLR